MGEAPVPSEPAQPQPPVAPVQTTPSKRWLWWTLGLVILFAIGVGIWWMRRPSNIPAPTVTTGNVTTPTTTNTSTTNTNANQPAATNTPTTNTTPNITSTTPTDKANITLTVKQLRTKYGIDGQTEKPFSPTVNISVPQALKDSLGAYEGGDIIAIGPVGWTGDGLSAADGGLGLNLYPAGGSINSGAHISFRMEQGCEGCAITSAAPFFPDGSKWLSDSGFSPNNPAPQIKSKALISPSLSSYSLVNTSDGLAVDGIAYIDLKNNQPVSPFYQAEVTLSTQQHDLATYVLNDFISRHGLK